jgi:hypothetical protein
MPDRIVELDGVQHVFPADATDAEIEAALGGGSKRPQSDSGAVPMAAAGAAIPAMARGAMNFATSPNVPKMGALAGRVLGGISPIAAGAYEAGPVGALAGMAASARGSWAGGKTGWFTGKMLQGIASPVAKGLDAVSPYAQGLSTLGGAGGVGDLAQMAEPNRKDIGTLGIGPSVDVPGAHPPVLNALYRKIMERLGRK